jgi:hypothetical protein
VSVANEGYSRHASCALNVSSEFCDIMSYTKRS